MCLSATAGLTGLLLLSQVPDLVVHEEEVYDDDDDENDEANWRNDYPDEESDADEDREERYGGKIVPSSSNIMPMVKSTKAFYRASFPVPGVDPVL